MPAAPDTPGLREPGGASGALLKSLLLAVSSEEDPVRHVESLPRRAGQTQDWPSWSNPLVVHGFTRRGIERPFTHQAQAAELAHDGRHVVVATGTASGKSLAYQLPVLTDLLAEPKACALYLAPTKALAADQLSSLTDLDLPGVHPALFDGDTSMDLRDWVRAHSRWILTNPDMIHRGILPQHARWGRLLRNLEYVVVDECHSYRGVFGSHVALVLRRLLRICRMYGAAPTVILASATVADPAVSASRLIGAPVVAITQDTAPRPGADFVLWEPGIIPDVFGENGAPVRRSAPSEAARMLADLVSSGARTLAFVRSRHGAEQTAMSAQRRLLDINPALVDRIAAYRSGYLPEERRALEKALATGELLGVASTNALELGVDISGLDAAILAGYPGTIASLWQQAGRAGRGDDPALVVFIARDDPLDSYLVHHPEAVFGKPVEAAITDPTNPHILRPHLSCAASETHLTTADLEVFGGDKALAVITELVADGVLRARATGWYYSERFHPASEVDLRGGGGGQVTIVESDTGRLLGTVDSARAPATVHPGAVHLHRGSTYLVDDLDLRHHVALVHQERPDWTTSARSTSTVRITNFHSEQLHSDILRVGFASVEVTEQVVGYLRRRPNGELIDMVPLEMPEHTLETKAVWYTLDEQVLAAAGVSEASIPGALHAAEHAAIGLLPLFAGCDRWDIGGLSTNLHPDTGLPTVIVYDGYPGGAGFAERGHEILGEWISAVRDAVRGCPCRAGCPSCVQSPKCGNGNNPLDKAGAIAVLTVVAGALGHGIS
ncbi:DEAD/DEAH box helicase [Nakamurella antarctica]|uniref:DEAD/DEAH box helicase n=1 Tax=Nakamurella antarctica TaxID=1902245 RepID=A0A3G8ZZA1_9ACTN|nr:DEAD/DEAH box helicase [Nakamurella antarctica]